MVSIRKATPAEKEAYQKEDPVYPLYGYVTLVDGSVCVIEDLRNNWCAPSPVFEVITPKGMVVHDEGLHNLLCFSLKDVKDRLEYSKLESCPRPCDWCEAE